MKKQRSYNNEIARYGCYFCVMLFFVEQVTKYEFSDSEVQLIFDKSKVTNGYGGKKALGDNCYMNDPAKIANIALELIKSDKKIYQIGKEESGRKSFWGGIGSKYDFIAQCWETPYGNHWITTGYNPDESIPLLNKMRNIFYKVV